MSKNSGILYSLQNITAWTKYKKCGRTSQKIKKRISNLQTSLLENCELIYTTETLLDCNFYEFLMKKILSKYRVRYDREFFDVENDEIKEIFDFFNFANSILNTDEKLNDYIKRYYQEYFNKKINYKNNLCSNEKKLKKRKGLFVDTSY